MLPSLATLLYVTLLTFWGLVGLSVAVLLGCAVLLACDALWTALSTALARVAGWCARWLYPEYTIPLGLAMSPVAFVAWALLRA